MKKYHIYGIGDAVVDFTVETSSQELRQLGVEKGVRCLVSADRQQELFDALSGKKIIRHAGGSAANSVIAAGQLGSKCFFSCQIGNDETGEYYHQDLIENNVDTNLSSETRRQGDSGKCLVMITEDADRTMNTCLGVTGDISYLQINEDALANSDILYFEGYMAASPTAKETTIKSIHFARENGVKIALSLSDLNMAKKFSQDLKDIIGSGVDLLFCNMEEAQAFANSKETDLVIKTLLKYCKALIVTKGEKGSLVASDSDVIDIAAKKVKAIDTNGAGDLYAGCFMHGFVRGLGLKLSAELASFAAGMLVSQSGSRLSADNIIKVNEYLNHLKSDEF